MASRRVLTVDEQAEIERCAVSERRAAEAEACMLGLSSPNVEQLVLLAAGPTKAVPSLSHDGFRLAGQLDCTGRLPTILYEAFDPPPRQRFSMAHELGHFVLHETRRIAGVQSCDQRKVDPEEALGSPESSQEAEADAFAAAFLVPLDRFAEAVEYFGAGTGFLAEFFGVSRQAMRRRLETLRSLRA